MEYVTIGKIINYFGLKGEVKVDNCSDFINDRYKVGSTIYVGDNYRPYTIRTFRVHKGYVMISFVGYDDLTSIEPLNLKESLIYKSTEDIKPLNKGEYYFKDLRDLDVYVNDLKVGKVIEVEPGKAYNFLRIKKDNKEYLVPNIKQFVLNINLDEKRIDIVNMEGLLWKSLY